jgi:hypothetical protein
MTGDVSNITIKDETSADERRDLALFYNMNDTLAYALWDHWLVNEQGEWYDYGMDHVREFRFDAPTQRYMVRDINDLGNGWEITDTLWTDYDGGVGVSPANPYNDFTVTVDGQGQPTAAEQTRYLEGFGIPAQQTVATGETRYLHGDLIRSTMLIRDELGSDQPTLAYTAGWVTRPPTTARVTNTPAAGATKAACFRSKVSTKTCRRSRSFMSARAGTTRASVVSSSAIQSDSPPVTSTAMLTCRTSLWRTWTRSACIWFVVQRGSALRNGWQRA